MNAARFTFAFLLVLFCNGCANTPENRHAIYTSAAIIGGLVVVGTVAAHHRDRAEAPTAAPQTPAGPCVGIQCIQ